MIANFFNKTRPINFLLLSILMLIVFVINTWSVQSNEFTFGLFFKKSIFLTLSILSIFVISFILRKNLLTENNSYALLFFILFFGLFQYSFHNEKILLSNFVLLFAFRRIYSLRTSLKPKEKIFDSALWVGVASLFYIWSSLYLILVYFAIFIFNKRNWRNIFIPIIGFITPVFLFYIYLLVIDNVSGFNEVLDLNFSLDLQNYSLYPIVISISTLIIFTSVSIFPTTKKFLLAKIDQKSTWFVLLFHILISLIIVMLAPEKNGSEFVFLFFPLSILFADYIQILKKYWIKEAIIYVFLIVLVIVILV
ncbi:MAG: hypothetical protein KAH67_07125 [Flavobacteriaceae bacterium]|nr:hypothetical protein [Flavobacteriaceae bacterium]